MKALVTGANGFTGSHLVKMLEERGDIVVGYVRPSSNLSRLAGTEAQLFYGDITQQEMLLTAMAGVDTVFHTAAYVELGIVDAEEMERVNLKGTEAVLAAAQATGVSTLVHCSTIGILGDTQGQAGQRDLSTTANGLFLCLRSHEIFSPTASGCCGSSRVKCSQYPALWHYGTR